MTELGQVGQGLSELETDFTSATEEASYIFPIEMIFEPAYVRAGRADRALEMLDEALLRIEDTGANIGAPELYRFKADRSLCVVLRRRPKRRSVFGRPSKLRAASVRGGGSARDREPGAPAARH